MPIDIDQFDKARQRGSALQAEYAAREAHYDATSGRVVITFPNELQISFLPEKLEGLQTATPAQLKDIELSPSGLSLHFPAVDADVYIPALMHNVLGSRAWMAQIGKVGGAVRSEKKAEAARANGALGGRPKKTNRTWPT